MTSALCMLIDFTAGYRLWIRKEMLIEVDYSRSRRGSTSSLKPSNEKTTLDPSIS